ncbi:phage_rel_nuc, putative phage-type endonuclease [uncultured Caudovirales phage]|uniref:Phage_rel_nuc, putative phage-type endonuclease n=1 Tax=uncultured Caudovirales phage TaxID=2100421 RepID=A0A6J5M4G4_9CAUD|nr:phage_rel_nuc, putative phage-type endonuclease [uncultured Caudovirales phage]
MDEQRTDEWFQQRLGKVTASNLHKVLAKTKTGYGADRGHYMTQLVLERITGNRADGYTSAAIQWGIEQEQFARAAYEAYRGVLVEEVGFIPHPTIAMAGASPDGLVEGGMVEIKCPESKTFLEVILSNNPVESKYFAQMQWQMRCADRPWCDYVVFDPRFPPKAQLFIVRVNRDDRWIEEAETEVKKFLAEVDEKVQALKQKIGE